MLKNSLLSKTKYLSGVQCVKRLWLEIYRTDLLPEVTKAQQRMFDQGHKIGEVAQTYFPGGVEVDTSSFLGAVEITKRLMLNDIPYIFEATFIKDGLYARVDVLRKTDVGWDIIEVKSSTRIKDVHITDTAFQYELLDNCGVNITGVFLMYVNKAFVSTTTGKLLITENIIERVLALRTQTSAQISIMKKVISGSQPDTSIGPHCNKPYTCPFQYHCWRNIPEQSVLTIPSIGSKGWDLINNGVTDISQITKEYELNESQLGYVDMIKEGKPVAKHEYLRQCFSDLQYPLHFLDFETITHAIPRYENARPNEQIPYQFSCHTLNEDGSLEHHEYLHGDESDPRTSIVEGLINTILEIGSVIVYTGFEERVIRNLISRHSEASDSLMSVINRLWDLYEVLKKGYQHPGFLGSYSIKRVLPVLVPNLSYHGRLIKRGDEAGVYWLEYINSNDDARRQLLREELLAYCRLDTLAMVRIFQVLTREVA